MKPAVGSLVFCSGKYCFIIFICNIVFGALAVLLNATVLTALIRVAKRRTWKVSNIILSAMAITDLCTGLICQPIHGYFVFRQKNVYKEEDLETWEAWLFLALVYSSYTFCCASLLIATLMAIERLMAVMYSLKHRAVSTNFRAITSLIIAGAVSAIIPIFRFASPYTQVVFMALLVLVVLLSLVTIIGSYTALFRSFKKQRIAAQKLSSTEKDRLRGIKQERRMAKTFALVTLILGLMYLPQMMLKPISIAVKKQGDSMSDLLMILEDSFNTFLYANAAVNPFIYFVRHEEVRNEIGSALSLCYFKRPRAYTTKSTTQNARETSSSHL